MLENKWTLFKHITYISPHVRLLVIWLVGRSVCHYFLTEPEFTFPCSYRSTCWIMKRLLLKNLLEYLEMLRPAYAHAGCIQIMWLDFLFMEMSLPIIEVTFVAYNGVQGILQRGEVDGGVGELATNWRNILLRILDICLQLICNLSKILMIILLNQNFVTKKRGNFCVWKEWTGLR